jgi:DNA invertase Pin-like site-specific DNA recombinase
MEKKYFIYCRKSTDEKERQVLSISAQLSITREAVRRHGIEVVKELTESRSAKTPGRPIFDRMMDDLKKGKVHGVIAHKPDRLSRNDTDSARIFQLMSNGVDFVFADTPVVNNAMGRANLGMQFVWAKFYSENLSEEVKKGLREKFRQGMWPTYAPLGYLNRDGKILVDTERAPLVSKAFQWFASNEFSVETLAQKIYDEGLRSRKGSRISKSVVHRILNNPFYYGKMQWGGMTGKGKHRSLVPRQTWERVQNILHGKARPHPVKHSFTYRGLLRCGGCGCAITAQYSKGTYIYYRCTNSKHKKCSQPYIREEQLTQKLAEIIKGVTLDKATLKTMNIELKRARQSIDAYREQILSSLKGRYTRLEQRKENLWNLRIDDKIPQNAFDEKLEKTIAEQDEIQEKIAQHDHANNRWYEQCSNFLELAHTAHSLFLNGEKAEKRKIVDSVCSNLILKDGKVRHSYKKPFDILVKGSGRSGMRGRLDALQTFFLQNEWQLEESELQ